MSNQDKNIEAKSPSFLLAIGIFFVPYIFSWLTLRPGYTGKSRKIAFSWMLIILGMAYFQSNTNPSNSASTKNQVAQLPSNPNLMPLEYSPDAAAIDAINAVDRLSNLIKEGNRFETFNFLKDNERTIATSCSHELCKSVNVTFYSVEKALKNMNDLDNMRTASGFLKESVILASLHKQNAAFKITTQKPAWISDDGIYGVYSTVTSLEQCKTLGDAIHLTKKKSIVVFLKENAKVSRKVASAELDGVNCIYRYNFGGKQKTQVLIGEAIKKEWKF